MWLIRSLDDPSSSHLGVQDLGLVPSDLSPVGRSQAGEERRDRWKRLRGQHHFSKQGELMVMQLTVPA
jgi:hypothetical protein